MPGQRAQRHILFGSAGAVASSHSSGLVGAAVGVGQVLLEDFGVTDGVKVGMALGFLGRQALLVVVAEKLVKEVDGLVGNKALVLRRDEAVPGLLLEAAENVVVLGIELNLVFVEVLKELVGAKDLSNLDKLIGVALAVEEGFFAENHRGKHGTETPHVEAVVIFLEVDQQLGALKVAGCDANVVFGSRVVELGKAPIDETQLWVNDVLAKWNGGVNASGKEKRHQSYLAVLVVNHDIVWLDITVHDALAVTEIQGLEELKNVEANIEVVELGVQVAEVDVVDVFEDERRGFALGAELVSFERGENGGKPGRTGHT